MGATGGSVDATRDAWREWHRSLQAFVRHRVAQAADADDIVQRVFLQLHRALPTLRDTDRLHVWLYRTARHAIADHYRAAPRRREATGLDAEDVEDRLSEDPRAPESDRAAVRELAACLRPLMATLPAVDQEALRLVDLEGVSQVDAARQLGLSISGMKSRVQRARKRLRGVLDACCELELDRRSTPIDYRPRSADACRGPC